MVTVSGDGVIVITHEGEGADGHGFLPDVKMKKPAHFPLLIEFEGGLFEAADAEHIGKEAELLLLGQIGVDRGFGVVDRVATGFFGLFGSGNAHVWVSASVGNGWRSDRGCGGRMVLSRRVKIVENFTAFGKRK